MILTLPDVRGLSAQPTTVRRKLADIAERNGWSVDGMAALIAHESGLNPRAKNPDPRSSASGFLQWTAAGSASLGVTPPQILEMDALEQLDLAERYWLGASGGRPIGPRDWLVLGLGTGNVGGYRASLPDSAILYASGTQGALMNPGLVDSSGNVTVGAARSGIDRMLAGVGRIPIVDVTDGGQGTVAAAAGIEALIWIGIGVAVLLRLRNRKGRR